MPPKDWCASMYVNSLEKLADTLVSTNDELARLFQSAGTSDLVTDDTFSRAGQLVGQSLFLCSALFEQGKRVSFGNLDSLRRKHDPEGVVALKARVAEIQYDLRILVLAFKAKHHALKARFVALVELHNAMFMVFDLETIILERRVGIESTTFKEPEPVF